MKTKIEIERRVYSNLVKTVIQTKKLLTELSNRPEFNKEWMTISDVEVEFGLSRKIIDGFRRKGLNTNQKTRNGKILIRRSELEKFLTKKVNAMDNNTTYIDDFITTRNRVKEWTQYFPKRKKGKKPLPKKYHYFKRRLYAEKGNSFLFLSLRYDDNEDIFRLRINGSLKKWYFNGNTLDNLTLPQYITCMKRIALETGITYDDILGGRNTKIESGVTICLKTKFKDLLKCFIWHSGFDRVEENETTLYFRSSFYSFILYEKLIEIKSKNHYQNGRFIRTDKPSEFTKTYLRFEVKVNSVSGVKFYEEKANSVAKIIENWDEIILQMQTFFKGIEFIDVNGAEKGFKNCTFPQFKKYTLFKQIKDFGLHNYIKLFKKEVRSGSNVTKYRNEIFSLFRSQVVEDIDLREELLFEFEKKINGLLYNKINSYSNSNNILIEE